MIAPPREKGLNEKMVENAATPHQPVPPPSGAPIGLPEPHVPDLAEHFLLCSKLGRYLTVSDGSRFVITDDFRDVPVQHEAAAVASIYSKDLLVAQARNMRFRQADGRFPPCPGRPDCFAGPGDSRKPKKRDAAGKAASPNQGCWKCSCTFWAGN